MARFYFTNQTRRLSGLKGNQKRDKEMSHISKGENKTI